MKQTVRLTESELRQLIEESVNQVLINEGFWSNVKAGAKNAFGSDASRMGKSASNAFGAVKRGMQNVGNQIQQGARNMKQGMQKRADAFKAGVAANANNDKLNDVVNKLQELQQSGVLHGAKTDQAVQILIGQINKLIGGNNSTAAAFRNQINN